MSDASANPVLRDLIIELNAANAGDMLEGYLDYLAEDFNPRLVELGLPQLDVFGERD